MPKPLKFLLTLMVSMLSIAVFGTLRQQNQDPNGSAQQQQEPQQEESQATPQGRTTSHVGVHSLTGCVAQSDHGYALKTKTGTYDIDTDQDMSKYVGKEIRISGIWEHHKTTHSQSESGNEPSGAAAEGEHASAAGTGPVESRDIRLRTVTSVVGDCH